jgi:hypothetical protein
VVGYIALLYRVSLEKKRLSTVEIDIIDSDISSTALITNICYNALRLVTSTSNNMEGQLTKEQFSAQNSRQSIGPAVPYKKPWHSTNKSPWRNSDNDNSS